MENNPDDSWDWFSIALDIFPEEKENFMIQEYRKYLGYKIGGDCVDIILVIKCIIP